MKQLLIPGVGGLLCGELIVDLFAGGGGASHGIEQALGRSPDVAINHNPHAVQMHALNHPATHHRCESIYDVRPADVTHGQPVGVLWASPSCTHFSRARGAKPVSKQERGLGWMILRWAALTGARVILAENVPEWETWGPVRRGQPQKSRAGKYFQQLVSQLRSLGYTVEWKTLVAADYGAPTTRKRLYLIARRDGQPITWPAPTHGKGRAQPFRTAAECIDWSDLGSSIFERKKPLAEATCRRIAVGIVRYVIEAKKPFLVNTAYGGTTGRGKYVYGADEPLRSITSSNGFALVSAFLAKHYGGVIGHGVEQPLGTVTATDHHSLVACHLTKFRQNAIGSDLADPCPTITSGANSKRPAGAAHALGLVAAFLTTYYSGGGTAHPVDGPAPAIVTKARHGLVTVEIDGTTYAIADIRLRMLKPAELARAQGFASDYILTGTQSEQIARIGNSVCPPVAAALVRANLVPGIRVKGAA